jgi:hypothetical protein
MLLCTRFHVCIDQAIAKTSPIEKVKKLFDDDLNWTMILGWNEFVYQRKYLR